MNTIRAFLPLILIAVLLTTGYAQNNNKYGPGIARQLDACGPEYTYKVWVYFKDKGPDEVSRIRSLATQLTKRSYQRRMRNGMNPLADRYDLPVYRPYLDSIRDYAAEIHHASRWLNAVSVNLLGKYLSNICSMSFIDHVEIVRSYRSEPINQHVEIQGSRKKSSHSTVNTILDYGLSYDQSQMIGVTRTHDLGFDGTGVLICILDGGFVYGDHEAFQHLNVVDKRDFLYGDDNVGDEPGDDGNSQHGTWVLGIIAGFAPGSLIGPAYNAKYLLAKTECSSWDRHIEEDNWVAGAEWADSLGADIISSSIGYRAWFPPEEYNYTWEDMDGNTAISTIGADIAASRGILVVNAVGNLGPSNPPENTLCAPADGDSVLAVGGVTAGGNYGSFSGMGPTADGRIKPDVMALGSEVYTVSATGPGYVYVPEPGTSWCAPQVAGAAALILQANPTSTNMELIDALRATAHQSTGPDNACGWGIVDCLGALMYFKPAIEHESHADTEDILGPYHIEAGITSFFPLIKDSIFVYYRTSGGTWIATDMAQSEENTYDAYIPGPGTSKDIEYYIYAANTEYGITAPWGAPANFNSFHVGTDITPPTIVHSPIESIHYPAWPPYLTAEITDNMTVDSDNVSVEWLLNSHEMDSFGLVESQDDVYWGIFPSVELSPGDMVEYRIVAYDEAEVSNISYHPQDGHHVLDITEPRAMILLICDSYNAVPSISAEIYERWLESVDFHVDVDYADSADLEHWDRYDLILSHSGDNTEPLSNSAYRLRIQTFLQSGGKILIEGGDIGKVMESEDPEFFSSVLHCTSWVRDFSGSLRKVSDFAEHPLVEYPNSLPYQIALTNDGTTSIHDAMVPDEDSYVIYNPTAELGKTGILVYDESDETPGIVFLAFNLATLSDSTTAQFLLENAVSYLQEESTGDLTPAPQPQLLEISLDPPFPHPIHNSSMLSFSLPVAAPAKLVIHNIGGHYVETILDDEHLSAGSHRIKWIARWVPSGLYVMRLTSREHSTTQKVLILK